jgi:TatA/E family protein of Tat protein translocase
MMPHAFLGSIGPMEPATIAGICLLFFGKRLPSVMRAMGQSVTELKKGVRDEDDQEPPFSIP